MRQRLSRVLFYDFKHHESLKSIAATLTNNYISSWPRSHKNESSTCAAMLTRKVIISPIDHNSQNQIFVDKIFWFPFPLSMIRIFYRAKHFFLRWFPYATRVCQDKPNLLQCCFFIFAL